MNDLLDSLWSLPRVFGLDDRDLVIALIAVGYGAMQLAGTTVRTGQHGLKYSFGRATSVLGPGFHAMIPGLQTIVQAPTRSQTLDLPTQRVRTAEGMVYEVNANVTFNIGDLRAALVEVADLDRGLEDVLALCVQEVMGQADRASLADLRSFDDNLQDRMQAQVRPWGVVLEQAGFTTVRPLGRSQELTQIRAVALERFDTLRRLEERGLPRSRALALMGTRAPYESRRRMARVREQERRKARRSPKAYRAPRFELPSLGVIRLVIGAVLALFALGLARACGAG